MIGKIILVIMITSVGSMYSTNNILIENSTHRSRGNDHIERNEFIQHIRDWYCKLPLHSHIICAQDKQYNNIRVQIHNEIVTAKHDFCHNQSAIKTKYDEIRCRAIGRRMINGSGT
jgi:microcystin-dependent protein